MKKILSAAVVVVIFLFVGTEAALATLVEYEATDIHIANIFMDAQDTDKDDFDYLHDFMTLLPRSYDPFNDIYISANLDLYFRDDNPVDRVKEKFKLTLDVTTISGTEEITDGAGGFTYTADAGLVGSAFSSDGKLHYYIHAQVGDFIFEKSELTAKWYYDNGQIEQIEQIDPVPEPATMLLLGTGLVGVAGAARRRKKKNQA